MATIEMTPENKPLFEALMRVAASGFPGRDADAEDVLVNAILELVQLRPEVETLRTFLDAWRMAANSVIDTYDNAKVHASVPLDAAIERMRALLNL